MAELSEIPLETLDQARQAALLRLHLAVTAETHRMVAAYGEGVKASLLDAVGEDGTLDAINGFALVTEAEQAWRGTFETWQAVFAEARRQAGAIAFGGLARQHQAFVEVSQRALDLDERRLDEQQDASPVFDPQLQAVLDAAAARVYDDGFDLSGRVWRLDRDSREGIRRVLLNGIANGESAWNLAQELEGYLGADQDCPRWTSTRLSRLTKAEIAAGDRRGLIARVIGTPCESRGVAYKALRLARNEIQIAHHAATDGTWDQVPWIEREQIVLSPDHPDIGCECEDIVAGGENGDGVYPKGEIVLPIHVQCLCNKLAMLMGTDAFVDRLRGWMTGAAAWPEMDAYADYVGVGVDDPRLLEPGLLVSWGASLVTWLWGDEPALQAALGLAVN